MDIAGDVFQVLHVSTGGRMKDQSSKLRHTNLGKLLLHDSTCSSLHNIDTLNAFIVVAANIWGTLEKITCNDLIQALLLNT